VNRIIAILTVFLLQLACMQVASAADNNVSVALHAFKVVSTAAGSKLVATESAEPGDIIQYLVTYSNTGKTAARDVLATLPVPQGGMVYVPETATPKAVLASVDGTSYAPMPLMRTVTRAGKQQLEAVPVSEYRFLRWKLGEIAPGASITVSSRMRLDSAPVINVRS
jgi:uncharacterized repeat protein (TIGR01451 family)